MQTMNEPTATPAAQPTAKGPSIYDGVKYIYAESLEGKAVTLTIKKVIGGIEFTDSRGKKNQGFDIAFEKTDKLLGVCGVTVRRQLFMACGTQDVSQWPGKKITIYPERSSRAVTGWAIRVKCDGGAQ